MRLAISSARSQETQDQPVALVADHLSIGHLSCGSAALMLVKQPHSLQRTPVWCRQLPHISRRFWRSSEAAIFIPDDRNWPSDLAAENAIHMSRERAGAEPGPV